MRGGSRALKHGVFLRVLCTTKYPTIFAKADLVLLTKVDLMPYLGVSLDAILDSLARAMPVPNVIALSTRGGLGVDDWLSWLQRNRAMAFEEVMA
jgi:hydrogenase nickel incorporation protein HypB